MQAYVFKKTYCIACLPWCHWKGVSKKCCAVCRGPSLPYAQQRNLLGITGYTFNRRNTLVVV